MKEVNGTEINSRLKWFHNYVEHYKSDSLYLITTNIYNTEVANNATIGHVFKLFNEQGGIWNSREDLDATICFLRENIDIKKTLLPELREIKRIDEDFITLLQRLASGDKCFVPFLESWNKYYINILEALNDDNK